MCFAKDWHLIFRKRSVAIANMEQNVLLLLLCFISYVRTQAFVGGSHSNCDKRDAFKYLGCLSKHDHGANAGFTWQLSSDPDSVNYYPGYNGSLTPAICQTACRGHGFKYAALSDQTNCFCSSIFPSLSAQELTAQSARSYAGSKTGIATARSVCQVPGQGCSGDLSQFCGSSSGADLYVDPTVPDSKDARQARNFQYLGCYTSADPGPFHATLATSSTAECAEYCGLRGYAYMGRNGIEAKYQERSDNVLTTCGCGSEVRTGVQVADALCDLQCSGTTGAA